MPEAVVHRVGMEEADVVIPGDLYKRRLHRFASGTGGGEGACVSQILGREALHVREGALEVGRQSVNYLGAPAFELSALQVQMANVPVEQHPFAIGGLRGAELRSADAGFDIVQVWRGEGVDGLEREGYRGSMSREQLTQAVMALPLPERILLAQDLWQSIDEGQVSSGPAEEREALAEAQRRDAELSSGDVVGRTHEQVMETMRRAIECA